MEIVYYRTRDGRCPVKEYLSSRYGIGEDKDSAQAQFNKVKRLAKIDSVIMLAADKRGVPGGNFSSSLIGCDFQELRITEGNELVRILYFAYKKEILVLLNVYDKPDLYEKAGKNEVNKRIEQMHQQTKIYYEDFLQNSNHYEKY
jgi:phage-related protein